MGSTMVTLQSLSQTEMHRVLAESVQGEIEAVLAASNSGHCLRVSALSKMVMKDLCATFNASGATADVVFLLGPHQKPEANWQVTATRLIELRNAEDRPLLAFIPPGLKAAAEDSFDVSTFREIDLSTIPKKLREELRAKLPDDIQRLTDDVIGFMEKTIRQINDDDIVRYYLTVLINGASRETIGGALYQFRLVPDFALADVPDRMRQRLDRNFSSVEGLLDGTQPLLGRIHGLKLKANTLQSAFYDFLRAHILSEVSDWAEYIATDLKHRLLSYDHWQFAGEDGEERKHLLLYVDELGLTAKDGNQPSGPDNPLYLDVKREKSVRIRWETDPKPATVKQLAYFRVELISADGAVIWESKNIRNGTSSRAYRSTTQQVAGFRDLIEEEGIYFFRVRAYSAAGDILNEEDADEFPKVLRDPDNPQGKRINESEDVWFWLDEEAPPPAEPQRNVHAVSFLDAQMQVRFAALNRGDDPFASTLQPQPDKTGWAKTSNKRPEAVYNIVYDAQARYTLSINSLLCRLERDTLAAPETLGRWRVDFRAEQATYDSVEYTARQYRFPKRIPATFMETRSVLFAAIQDEADNLLATVDLLKYEGLILAYAQAYNDWLAHVQSNFEQEAIIEENGRRRTEPIFLDMDLVELLLPRGERVFLLAPTHPLRLLWHLQQARMAHTWLSLAITQGEPTQRLNETIRLIMRRGFTPINLPPVIRIAHEGHPEAVSRFYVEQGALTPFWALYLREDVRDKQTIRARVQRALGMTGANSRSNVSGDLEPKALTQKMLRYLVQHPYTHVLKINVFNPGNASLIVDAILGLEKTLGQRPALRYELRLFTQSERIDEIGEAVEELSNPERQVSAEADAFTVASKNHLFPKLRYSRNTLDDFLADPEQYEAHLSILRDLFPVDVEPAQMQDGRSSFVYGLLQEPITRFTGDEVEYVWQRQLLPTACEELPSEQHAVSALLGQLLRRINVLQSAVAVGRAVDSMTPTLGLSLPIKEKGLLYQVHAVSDWVLIVDRYLGLEYFDSKAGPERPIYLLDFTPEFSGADTERLLLTTRATEEVTRLIRPILDKYDLLVEEGTVELFFLQLLRSLSGRLALKLLSSPNHVNEALGLAMARLFLEQYGLLKNAIVLPLDAHSDLFSFSNQLPSLDEAVSLQRSDLLFIACEPDSRTLHFQAIEVKWRSDLGDFSVYMGLRQRIESQLSDTETTLRQHFDPTLHPIDRLDRQLKTKELISLLGFYLERSRRYGLVTDDAAPVIRNFIQSLDQGYRLTYAGAGLIFDFTYEGIHSEEEHAGLIFHRVGKDYIHRLLNNGLRRQALLQKQETEKPVTVEESEQKIEERAKIVEDTTMYRDPSYIDVRTYFPVYQQERESISNLSTEECQTEGSVEPSVKLDEPGITDVPAELELREFPDFKEESTAQQELTKTVPEFVPTIPQSQPDQEEQQPEITSAESQNIIESSESIGSHVDAHEGEQKEEPEEPAPPTCDVLLGSDEMNLSQFGLLGQAAGKFVGLDLNGTNTISLFGVQGGGKSYTLGSMVEMATQEFLGVSKVPAPLATVIFHYHESQDYAPEFVSMVAANNREAEIKALESEYGAYPDALEDVLLLTSPDKIAERQAEFPSVQVEPIYFSSNELSIKDWRFLMGAMGNQMYMKQINLIMRQLREQLTLEALQHEIENSALSETQKSIARVRLTFAAEFIDDNYRLAERLRPGRLIIVDLRDEFIEKEEALGLFVVMLNIFANAGREEGFNKLIVFDEAHKYMDNQDLTSHIVDVIRQMRHQGVSLLIASQDPPSLPYEIIELSSVVILHRFNSPQWLKHVQRSITSLSDLTPAQMASLRPGEAYVWATKATERIFTQKAVKMRLRPRVTQHGGGTKTAT